MRTVCVLVFALLAAVVRAQTAAPFPPLICASLARLGSVPPLALADLVLVADRHLRRRVRCDVPS